jgi:hypothetical protein
MTRQEFGHVCRDHVWNGDLLHVCDRYHSFVSFRGQSPPKNELVRSPRCCHRLVFFLIYKLSSSPIIQLFHPVPHLCVPRKRETLHARNYTMQRSELTVDTTTLGATNQPSNESYNVGLVTTHGVVSGTCRFCIVVAVLCGGPKFLLLSCIDMRHTHRKWQLHVRVVGPFRNTTNFAPKS